MQTKAKEVFKMDRKNSNDQPFITPREASELSSFALGTLANHRHRKIGCPYFRRGGKVLYDRETFLAWCKANPVKTIETI